MVVFRFSDGGLTYDPQGCRYNNSTTTVHEVAELSRPAGIIWRALTQIHVLGALPPKILSHALVHLICSVQRPALNWIASPIKLVNAFVGSWVENCLLRR